MLCAPVVGVVGDTSANAVEILLGSMYEFLRGCMASLELFVCERPPVLARCSSRCPGRDKVLGVPGREHSSVPKSNRLHVVIFWGIFFY